MKDHHELLTGFPVVITLPLLWGDQDSFSHVNNIVYLRWCETARVDYLNRVGLWPQKEPPSTLGPILARICCDYKVPLSYPDTIHVGARITHIGNSSFRMEHVIVSHTHNTLAAAVDSTLVVLDYSCNKSTPVPLKVRAAIEKLEGRSFAAAK